MKKYGFTLIELLVVVLIIGILAAIALPSYKTSLDKTKFTEVFVNLNAINKAMGAYFLEHNKWPTEFKDLNISFGKKCTARDCQLGKFTYTFANIASKEFAVYKGAIIPQKSFALSLVLEDNPKINTKSGDIICTYRNNPTYEKLCLALNGKTKGTGHGGGPFYTLDR